MRRFMRSHWILAVALLAALPAFAQGDYKGEALSSPAPADVPKALQDALQAQGARLLDAQGKPLGEIWLAKAIAGQASERVRRRHLREYRAGSVCGRAALSRQRLGFSRPKHQKRILLFEI